MGLGLGVGTGTDAQSFRGRECQPEANTRKLISCCSLPQFTLGTITEHVLVPSTQIISPLGPRNLWLLGKGDLAGFPTVPLTPQMLQAP